MEIVCVGGGPAGLCFAIQMKRLDPSCNLTVLERNEAGITHGWGIGSSELLESLSECDPELADQIAAGAYRWHGQVVAVNDESVAGANTGYSIGRHQLIDILVRRAHTLGVRVVFGHEVGPSDPHLKADLVVAADGVNSQLRQQYAQAIGSEIAVGRNKYIWLGTTKVFEAFTFAFVESEAGWLWCYAYGYGKDQSTFVVECSPTTWRGLGFDVLSPDESLSLLEQRFRRHLGDHRLMVQSHTENGLPWQNFRTVHNDRWHHGNTVLIGDAAHTTHYAVGAGTQLAFEDAVVLANLLKRHVNAATAIAAYEQQRRRAVLLAQRDARAGAAWFENITRYVEFDAERFAWLLNRRCSPVLGNVPPATYYRLHGALKDSQVLRGLSDRVGDLQRSLYLRRQARRTVNGMKDDGVTHR